MKKIHVFITLSFLITVALDARNYTGPLDLRMSPRAGLTDAPLGTLSQLLDIAALADVIEVVEPADGKDGHIKVRVINPIWGCTNSQEVLILKEDPWGGKYSEMYSPRLREAYQQREGHIEFYPTNHSRIVFAVYALPPLQYCVDPHDGGLIEIPCIYPRRWKPADWKLPPDPEVFLAPESLCSFFTFNRSWWYDGYQDNLPYAHLTNLVRAARVERNWTNYYHILRGAVPTPASPRVWQDSFTDIDRLTNPATRSQYDYIANDPLFPAEMRERLEFNEKYVIDDD